ncbi:MAG: TonB-dependent siderophore receptor [Methylobacter sp.]|nr:MAG: TonB-dependent siderophore receptor [Methylobacter sp.]PPD22305.1 MAG: TonB-dependent siderophore receptor [Methylobacter sp.]PPD36110.1 MAG: TonB-dependent siderophore receptor [Methylomonas sp.]
MKTIKSKHILTYSTSLTLALLMSQPSMAAEPLKDKKPPAKNAKEGASITQKPETVELKAVTVEGEAVRDANDPNNKNYTVTNSRTATKTDTPIIETPVSVQVVPRSVLSDQKTTRVTEALENVSGVRAQSSLGAGTGFIIRGFRTPLIYRNGLVAVPNGFRSEFDTSNIESIEVLKGPASVLFGRSEPGGLINVTTKKPLDIPYYSLEQRFGSFDLYRTEWDATGPVNDDKTLLYRFTGSYQDSNSFRDFISNDRVLIAPSLTWRPNDATDFTINVEGFDQDYQADYGIPAVGNRPANIPLNRAFGDPNDPIDSISKVQLGTELNHRFNNNWAIHNRFLASWGEGRETFLNPAPAFGNGLNEVTGILQRNVFSQRYDSEAYTTNLDLTGKFAIAQTQHEILLGFDYLRSFTNYNIQGFFDTANPALAIDINNPGPSYGIDPSVFSNAVLGIEPSFAGRNFNTFKDEWYGAYFQDHITLWNKLHIVGGGRYDWIETGRGRGGSFAASENALENSTPSAIRKDEGLNPRVGILYQPWQWLGVYGNWTTSLAANNGISSTNQPFDPQEGEQFEAGIKTAFFDQRLLTTLAYYHLTRDNLLTPDLTTLDPNDSAAIGQQRSQGIELDVLGRLTENLSIISSYAFTDARIIQDNRTLNGVLNGYEGLRLNNVPEHSGSVWLKFDANGTNAQDGWSAGLGTVFASGREGDVENTFKLPGYVRVDAFAAYKLKVGPTRVTTSFNIRNLLDKEYFESTDPDANVAPRLGVYPGAPLTAIGSIRVEY